VRKAVLAGVVCGLAAGFATALLGSVGLSLGVGFVAALAAYGAFQLFRLWRHLPGQSNRLRSALQYATSANAAVWMDRVVQPRLPLPPLAGWALDPETAGYVLRHVMDYKPQLVVELGSGVSTVITAYAMEKNGFGRVISFDGEAEFAERTRKLLSLHGLDQRAEVRHAPLVPLDIDGWEGVWYEIDAFSDLGPASVNLLIVDGPPGSTSPLARYPALPVLLEHLGPDGRVLLDDSARGDETEILQRWQEMGWAAEVLPVGDGAAMLRPDSPERSG